MAWEPMATVYLGIGSNLGNRRENVEKANGLLTKNNIEILKSSLLIETNPVGGPPQGKFLNGVLKVKTNLEPWQLLKALKSIESSLGRTKTVVNGPRTIDLDILLYDDIQLKTPDLTIPHPCMLERHFVMTPLKEIEPELYQRLIHAHR